MQEADDPQDGQVHHPNVEEEAETGIWDAMVVAHVAPDGEHAGQVENLSGRGGGGFFSILGGLPGEGFLGVIPQIISRRTYIIEGAEQNCAHGLGHKATLFQRHLADVEAGAVVETFIFGVAKEEKFHRKLEKKFFEENILKWKYSKNPMRRKDGIFGGFTRVI
jgi:hypothetical protein